MIVSISVKPLSKAGTWELTVKLTQGRGVKRILLKKFEYCVRSYGLSRFTSKKLSSSNQVTVWSSRRVSKRLRRPTRQTVQLSKESIEVNCGKSIARSWVEGSNRSNPKIDVGLGPSSLTYEKFVNGWITCMSPPNPNARLCTFSQVREILKDASAPVLKTVRNVSPSNLTGLANVGDGRMKSGTSGFDGGMKVVDPRSHVVP